MATLPEREQFVQRGFDFQEAELATARLKLSEKARGGNTAAAKALKDIKEQQRSLTQRRTMALATIRREPELIAPGHLTFLAHALIVPSANPDDLERHDAAVEKVAMDLVRAYEEAAGAVVKDVHTPELARAAGLTDNPGFDLLSIRPAGDAPGDRGQGPRGHWRRGGQFQRVGQGSQSCATAIGFTPSMTAPRPPRGWRECRIRSALCWPRPRVAF